MEQKTIETITYAVTASLSAGLSTGTAVLVLWKYMSKRQKYHDTKEEARYEAQTKRYDERHKEQIELTKTVSTVTANSVTALNNLAHLVDEQTKQNKANHDLIVQHVFKAVKG